MASKFALLFALYVAVFVGAAAIGCKKANPMVGTWTMQIDQVGMKDLPAGMEKPSGAGEFKDDGTFTVSMKIMGMENSMSGTYTLVDKALTMTPKMEDGKPSSDKPETVTLSEDMKSFDIPGSGGQGKMVKQ